MRRRTYTLYNLDELPAEARTKVLDHHRYINVDDAWWYQCTVEHWKAELEAKGYEDARILFSGFHSQGDGASFEAQVNLKQWLDQRGLTRKYRRLLEAIAAFDVEVVLRHSGYYYHEYSTHVETSYSGTDREVEKELAEVEALTTDEKIALSRDIYRDLESAYEGHTNDGAVADTLDANEFEFFRDGQVATKNP